MHRTLKIFLALLLLFTASYGYARMMAGFSSGTTVLDPFTYDDGELELKSAGNFVRWDTNVNAGVINVDTNKIKYASGSQAAIYVHKTTFLSGNVYAQVTLDTAPASMDFSLYINAAGSGDSLYDGYALNLWDNAGTETITIHEILNGAWTAGDADVTTGYSAGDVWKFTNEYGVLKVYKNGALVSGLTVTDATYSAGRVGIVMTGNGPTTRLDNFEGGDIR